MDTFEIIKKYGLSIRQIPTVVTRLMEVRHYDPKNKNQKIIRPEGWNRDMVQTKKYPTNGGYWMCQKVDDTGTIVRWDIKMDFLAPTLEESVQLYLNSIK